MKSKVFITGRARAENGQSVLDTPGYTRDSNVLMKQE